MGVMTKNFIGYAKKFTNHMICKLSRQNAELLSLVECHDVATNRRYCANKSQLLLNKVYIERST